MSGQKFRYKAVAFQFFQPRSQLVTSRATHSIAYRILTEFCPPLLWQVKLKGVTLPASACNKGGPNSVNPGQILLEVLIQVQKVFLVSDPQVSSYCSTATHSFKDIFIIIELQSISLNTKLFWSPTFTLIPDNF